MLCETAINSKIDPKIQILFVKVISSEQAPVRKVFTPHTHDGCGHCCFRGKDTKQRPPTGRKGISEQCACACVWVCMCVCLVLFPKSACVELAGKPPRAVAAAALLRLWQARGFGELVRDANMPQVLARVRGDKGGGCHVSTWMFTEGRQGPCRRNFAEQQHHWSFATRLHTIISCEI